MGRRRQNSVSDRTDECVPDTAEHSRHTAGNDDDEIMRPMEKPRHTRASPQLSLSLARCALSTIFFLNGVVLASWVPHIPAVKARHAVTDGQLGLILLSMAVGS